MKRSITFIVLKSGDILPYTSIKKACILNGYNYEKIRKIFPKGEAEVNIFGIKLVRRKINK